MKHLLLTILSVVFVCQSYAQITVMKWGKYSNTELEMTEYEQNKEANAVILGKQVKIKAEMKNNNFVMSYDFHYRIKILTKEGLSEADIELPYYAKKRAESITGIRAQTVNLKNGKVETIKIKKKEIFLDKLSDNVSAKKFTFTGAEIGSILEYKYSLQSDYIFQLDDIYFQREIPLKWARLKVEVPEFFSYVIIKQSTKPFDVETQRAITYDLGVDYKKFSGTEYTWELNNVPALKEEAHVTTMNDYRFRVRLQLQSTSYPLITKNYFTTWGDAKKQIMDDEDFGERLKDKESIRNINCKAIHDNSLSDKDKMIEIYEYVQNNMKWNERNSIYANEKLNDSFKAKTGSAGDINLMLLRLLKEADITAYPVLISTRKHGKPNPYYPIMKQFNYVLVQATIDGKDYLLDAVNPNLSVGTISFNCLNQLGWLLKGASGEWINIPPAKHKTISQIKLQLEEDGSVKGELTKYYDAYAGLLMRNRLEAKDEKKYIEDDIKEDIPDIEVTAVTLENKDDNNAKLIKKIEFTVPQMAEVGGDMIYLSPMLNEGWDENPFKLKERKYPIDMGFTISEQIIINVYPPAGYIIDEMPQSAKVSLGEKGGRFSFLTSKMPDGSIQIVSRLSLKKGIYEVDEYELVKEFFDMFVEKHLLQLVFKKAQP